MKKRLSSTTRTLWVHAGAHKTGSTSIQNYLNRHGVPRTTSREIFYKTKLYDQEIEFLDAGNGQGFVDQLLGDLDQESLQLVMKDFLGNANEGLISCENLAALSAKHWEKFKEAGAASRIELKVIIFIRDLMPFMSSDYDQHLRHGLTAEDFNHWCMSANWSHATALRSLAQVFAPGSLRVLHYESAKGSLFLKFFEALGLEGPSFKLVDNKALMLNTALSNVQRDLLIWINNSLKGQNDFSQVVIARALQNTSANAQREKPDYNLETFNSMSLKFTSEKDWINRTFFGGRPVVSLGDSYNSQRTSATGSGSAHIVETYRSVLAAMLKKANIEACVLEQLKSINKQNLSDQAIPSDFCPVAYLLKNSDLINPKFDFLDHFLQHGKAESRPYKW